MLATYMRRTRNNNLEIRIAASSCRRQLLTQVDEEKLSGCAASKSLFINLFVFVS